MKKALSLLLAVALILSLGTTAFAASTGGETQALKPGSITLSGVHEGETYRVYKLLDLESYDAENKLYVYTLAADSPWLGFFQSETNSGSKWVNLTLQTDAVTGRSYYSVTLLKAEGAVSADQLALDAITYAKKQGIEPTKSEKIGQVATFTFVDLDLGYYLIDSTVGALCGLTNTDPSTTVAVKNNPPVIVKKVQENSTDDWGEKNDDYIGATVNFTTTFHKELGAQNYVIHDYMDAGLTLLTESFNLTYTASSGSEVAIDAAVYDIEFNVACTDTEHRSGETCSFEVSFDNVFLRNLAVGTEVNVTYSALLNEDALVDGPNHNETYMTYGDHSHTNVDFTDTYTWSFGLYKYSPSTLDPKAPLKDAKFSIYAKEPVWNNNGVISNNVQPMPFIYEGIEKVTIPAGVEKEIPVYRIASREEQEANVGLVTEFTTTEVGYIKFIGLDSKTGSAEGFYLREIEAPKGYTLLSGLIKVNISTVGTVSVNDIAFPGDFVEILNQTGAALPETGGTGTTVIYILGATLMLGALVLLITKRRVSAN